MTASAINSELGLSAAEKQYQREMKAIGEKLYGEFDMVGADITN
jgi:hypothetical protein